MIPTKTARGRPKGSGLNDFAQLRAIAGLMISDPGLPPTTAIKALGIHDPSVIRRLRDKYKACEAELMAEMKAHVRDGAVRPAPVQVTLSEPQAPTERPAAPSPEAARTPGRAIALSAGESPRISKPVAAPAIKLMAASPAPKPAVPTAVPVVRAASPIARERAPRAVPLPSETNLPEWVGIGLSVYVMSIEAQFAVVGTLFEWPPLAAVLRSQVAFAELAVASVRPVPDNLGLAAHVRP